MKYEMIDTIFLVKVAGQNMIVSLGGENGLVPYTNVLNETGAFYFNLLREGSSVDEMIEAAMDKWDASRDEIEPGLLSFLDMFERIGYISCM